MLGYLNAVLSTDPQAWYCTGDLVDEDGKRIRFRGRKTDMINVGGGKVSPTEIELLILQLDFVTDALVSGRASHVPWTNRGRSSRARREFR